MTETSQLFVLTGGPGSGKTTLIDALAARGHACSTEAGRSVIQDQVKTGGRALPWADRELFAEQMLAHELESYRLARQRPGIVFFDRGIPDVAGYLRLSGLPVSDHVAKAVGDFRYNSCVFIAPPWREIFRQDRERKQDFAEALRTYDMMAAIYAALDYNLLELPKVSVEERADFVLDVVAAELQRPTVLPNQQNR
jgi:predicted ATPase